MLRGEQRMARTTTPIRDVSKEGQIAIPRRNILGHEKAPQSLGGGQQGLGDETRLLWDGGCGLHYPWWGSIVIGTNSINTLASGIKEWPKTCGQISLTERGRPKQVVSGWGDSTTLSFM